MITLFNGQVLTKAQEDLLHNAVMAEARKQGAEESEVRSVWLQLKDSPKQLQPIREVEGGKFAGVDAAVRAILDEHPRWLSGREFHDY